MITLCFSVENAFLRIGLFKKEFRESLESSPGVPQIAIAIWFVANHSHSVSMVKSLESEFELFSI